MSTTSDLKELLIVSVTPQNLERGVLWFKENAEAIEKARFTNPWWRENTMWLEPDLVIKPSLLIRRLIDLGYERAGIAAGKGIFAPHGGLIEVWPVSSDQPWLIEFVGNAIASIQPRESPPHTIEARPHYRGLASIVSMPVGGYAVHRDHGIGIFRGASDGSWVLEYAAPGPGREPDRLLVPLDQKDRITPYVGFTTPTVHRLGGTLWINTRRRVREDAEKLAKALLLLYAGRASATRPPYAADQQFLSELAQSFGYEETAGQREALNSILNDLAKERPMDRLLVGDVGFGKTEIAIRASAAAISTGKQVAVLAPTTVLAAQHKRTFRERFAALPIRAAALSRLTPGNQTKRILEELATGRIDCIIGTHRLLSRDVKFKNLGLVIIDEEQRFGVKQKERFKELRGEADILSLSATPIPRTLSLALAKIRDVSRIDTPPAGRIPIITAVLPYGKKIIKDAIVLELERGGQVYFLHNRIETIGAVEEKLKKIIHSAISNDRMLLLKGSERRHPVIGVIHGRMKEKELITAMERFRNQEIDILIATTIIENGLDISSANTLIVDDATRLGLAEAHQLRGRIGRGATQAFAYFLYRPRHLTDKAAARLDALKEYADLGAGYDIALSDLEIRGAGNILGREQAGAVNKVGLNLYCQMLAEAVEQTQSRRQS